MPKEQLRGYWDRKGDPAEFIHVDRHINGYVLGFRYFIRDGEEKIDPNQLRLSEEDLKRDYVKR